MDPLLANMDAKDFDLISKQRTATATQNISKPSPYPKYQQDQTPSQQKKKNEWDPIKEILPN